MAMLLMSLRKKLKGVLAVSNRLAQQKAVTKKEGSFKCQQTFQCFIISL